MRVPAPGPRWNVARRRRPISWPILVGGAMVLPMIGAFVLLFAAVTDLRGADTVARRSAAVLTSAERLERLVLSLDEDTRALALTGAPGFRHAYDADRAAFSGEEARFERLTAGSGPDEARRAGEFVRAENAYLRDQLTPLVNAARRDGAGARTLASDGRGLPQLASLRERSAGFEAAQGNAAVVSARHAADAAHRTAIFVTVCAAAALLLVFFVAFLPRAIIRPIRHAADLAGALADEQRALRRVATLVACGVPPARVFAAVAAEVGRVLKVDYTVIIRFESDETALVVGHWSDPRVPEVMPPLGGRWPVEEGTVTAETRGTEGPARMKSYERATSAIGVWTHQAGIRCVVGCPVKVEGRVWGAMLILSLDEEPPPGMTEARMRDFTELVGTAIVSAQGRSDLLASRARVVAAADESRRRIERDLHDGAQQRLVTVALRLRTLETAVAPGQERLREQLSGLVDDLSGVLDDLQEVSRGIVPPILGRSGLGPALRSLSRRSPVGVRLNMGFTGRLPERVEVAVYYTVAEALTNVAKHARASEVRVDLILENRTVRLSVHDDGRGGADLTRGSGLVGLKDRVEALGGSIEIISPPGNGTSILVGIPVEPADDGAEGPDRPVPDAGART
ncbi:histidine kinase [Actinoallomurus sp. NBC_01490]|uniref:sensor histidine kinase n=1 Tax=Actinoallomurus sp. NBC_01490 TaxID=2903557 RepID=UPI002E331E26|nr:histidine kinase [Actinoallomurus sp. NBC_01490]